MKSPGLLASPRMHGEAARDMVDWMDAEQYRDARCAKRKGAEGKIFQSLLSPFQSESRQLIGKCGKREIP